MTKSLRGASVLSWFFVEVRFWQAPWIAATQHGRRHGARYGVVVAFMFRARSELSDEPVTECAVVGELAMAASGKSKFA